LCGVNVKKYLKYGKKTMKWCFIVFCFYALSLCFRQARVPGEWVARALATAAPSNFVFHCESASFGLFQGFHVRGLRVYDLARARRVEPAATADLVSVHVFRRRVRVVGATFPRLHDAYYELNTFSAPLGDGPLSFSFPSLPSFRLEFERPEILGVAPERVSARVRMTPGFLEFSQVHLAWRDRDRPMALDGWCRIDLDARRVNGRVEGLATQAQIRPMIVALDLPAVLPYLDGFTGVTEPVPAICGWNVDLRTNEFLLDLDLQPKLGRYNGVPMSRADGKLAVHATFGADHMRYETRIGPLRAVDKKDRSLNGQIVVRGFRGREKEIIDLDFDASSALPMKSILDIIDYLNDGLLDCLVCETPPQVTVKGRLAADVARQAENDLSGTIAFARGSLFGIPLREASSSFSYVGNVVSFTNAVARGCAGGTVTGRVALSVPGLDRERAGFRLALDYSNGSVAELAESFGFTPGDVTGRVDGSLTLSGALRPDALDRLKGAGRVTVRDGHIAQMKLFLGLTELLAKEVPGVDRIVTQSAASGDFTVEGGVVRSDNILIEGSFFTILANGTYDFLNDKLDFTVRVTLLKNESLLGKFLIRPILWPFTKLLLEFKVEGGMTAPRWRYISVLDRIL
jgi:hypothetical protein